MAQEKEMKMSKEVVVGDSFIGWGWYFKGFDLGISIDKYHLGINLGFFWLWIEW
jgi:hypothetical protein